MYGGWLTDRLLDVLDLFHTSQYPVKTPFRDRAVGVDSFQALALGLHLPCSQLDEVGAMLSFLNGREGDAMTPMIVFWPFGSEGKADIHRYVQAKFKEELDRR